MEGKIVKDIIASAKWMAEEFAAAGVAKMLGIIGFCLGGGQVIEVLARDERAYFGIGASFYGTRIDPSIASDIKVPSLFVSGGNHLLCPVNVLKDLEKSIGQGSRAVIFEGRDHGFANRPNSSEEDKDADRAFTLLRNWLHDGLVVE